MAKSANRKTTVEQDRLKRDTLNALEGGEDVGELEIVEAVKSLFSVLDFRGIPKNLRALSFELLEISRGQSEREIPHKDWRFKDESWQHNPFYKRMAQSYLAWCDATRNSLSDNTDWRTRERAEFMVEALLSTLAPTNTLAGNPAAIKEAINSGGMSLVRGWSNLVDDLINNKGMPRMVDETPFVKGENIAATPGAVVFRNEVLELLQYQPATAEQYATPMLLVPPQINRYYFTDLAPGRSLVEYAVNSGIQIFVVSWRNPTPEQGDWGLDTYLQAVYEAIDAMLAITQSETFNAIGFCAGGITLSTLAAHMAANKDSRLNSISMAVTLLDWNTPAMVGMLQSEHLISHVKNRSLNKGIIDGKSLGKLFALFRPNELLWNYWVNNYLMGRQPPSFDILAWNADSTNLPGQLHAEFLDIFYHNVLTRPGELKVLNQPIDLGKIKCDAFITGGSTDHLTPWRGCYRSTQLLGSKNCEFVLSSAGHIASLVNPPGNPKASYYRGQAGTKTPNRWKRDAEHLQGSWWEYWVTWVVERSGDLRSSPENLGNDEYPALADAPGTYIHS